jgi:hypothetical protein
MKNKKAVEIAKDVISQLDSKKISAKSGTYLTTPVKLRKGSLQDQLRQYKRPCKVCQVGALFVAHVAKNNQFDVYNGYFGLDIDRDDMQNTLSHAFSEDELDDMEHLFEEGRPGPSYEVDGFLTALFNSLNHEERMRAMMQEVIRQNGGFVIKVFEEHLINQAVKDFKLNLKK